MMTTASIIFKDRQWSATLVVTSKKYITRETLPINKDNVRELLTCLSRVEVLSEFHLLRKNSLGVL